MEETHTRSLYGSASAFHEKSKHDIGDDEFNGVWTFLDRNTRVGVLSERLENVYGLIYELRAVVIKLVSNVWDLQVEQQ